MADADISNVINVSLLESGRLASYDNPNAVMVVTSETGFLSSTKRFEIYSNLGAVATDFGTHSKAYAYAAAVFGTSPNPISFGGYLVIGFWRAANEAVPATSAILRGAQISEAATVGALRSVTDGSFGINVDGSNHNVENLNFTSVSSLDDVVAVIEADAGLSAAATVTLSNNSIVITSKTTGATSTISYAVTISPASGTDISALVGLAEGLGGSTTQGEAAGALTAESKLDAVTEIKKQVFFRGYTFIDKPINTDVEALAAWGQAEGVLSYDTFNAASNLVKDASNPVWKVVLSSQTNYRMQYSKAGNRLLSASYMARMHTTNFAAENSAITMNLKELVVSAEEYTQGEIDAAKEVGLDIYTTIKKTPVLLTSGANDFTDNRYNLIAFKGAMEIDLFNFLKSTSTKISQTTPGVNSMVDQCEKTTRQYSRAGVFAPGTWTSPDRFGDYDTFNRGIEQHGYYYLAGKLSDQAQADREARKAPVIQGAVKLSGAIHSADVIINVNK